MNYSALSKLTTWKLMWSRILVPRPWNRREQRVSTVQLVSSRQNCELTRAVGGLCGRMCGSYELRLLHLTVKLCAPQTEHPSDRALSTLGAAGSLPPLPLIISLVRLLIVRSFALLSALFPTASPHQEVGPRPRRGLPKLFAPRFLRACALDSKIALHNNAPTARRVSFYLIE